MRLSILQIAMIAACWSDAEAFVGFQSAPFVQEDKKRMDQDIELIDAYLVKWDRFAKGEKSLVADINREGAAFVAALGRGLKAKDKRAPSRLVFSVVVQVGGGIPVDSEVGRHAATILGPDFPVVEVKQGKVYFAGDLYFWWLEHQKEFNTFPLLDEWANREFAQKSVIPMYNRAREKAKERRDQ